MPTTRLSGDLERLLRRYPEDADLLAAFKLSAHYEPASDWDEVRQQIVVTPRNTKHDPVQWKDMVRALWMFGLIDNFTRATCFDFAEKLKAKVQSGEVERTKIGRNAYYRIRPDLLDQFGPSGDLEDVE